MNNNVDNKTNIGPIIGWIPLVISLFNSFYASLSYTDYLETSTGEFWVKLIFWLAVFFYSLLLVRGHKKIMVNKANNINSQNGYQNAQYGNHSAGSVDKHTLYSHGNNVYDKNDNPVEPMKAYDTPPKNVDNNGGYDNGNKPVYESNNYQNSNMGSNSFRVSGPAGNSLAGIIFFFIFWFGFLMLFDFVAFVTGSYFMVFFSAPFWIVGVIALVSAFGFGNK